MEIEAALVTVSYAKTKPAVKPTQPSGNVNIKKKRAAGLGPHDGTLTYQQRSPVALRILDDAELAFGSNEFFATLGQGVGLMAGLEVSGLGLEVLRSVYCWRTHVIRPFVV